MLKSLRNKLPEKICVMINQQLLCFKLLTVNIPLDTVSQHTETAWRILVCMITSILLLNLFPIILMYKIFYIFLK